MSFLSFSLAMNYVIHKILVLIKNYLNYFKENIFECFFKKYILFFKKVCLFFFIIYNNGKFKSWRKKQNIIKDVRNLFRLKKEQNYTAVKDIRNFFRQQKRK